MSFIFPKVSEVDDFEEENTKTQYISHKKMVSGEQPSVWYGYYKKVYLNDKSIYDPQICYVFKGENGDFVLPSTKVVYDRMSNYRIGDFLKIQFLGMVKSALREGKVRIYASFNFFKSDKLSMDQKQLIALLEEVDKENSVRDLSNIMQQPLPDFMLVNSEKKQLKAAQ